MEREHPQGTLGNRARSPIRRGDSCQLCQLARFGQRDECSREGHLEGRIEQSSQPQECPAHGLPRPCKAMCHATHFGTRRKSTSVFAAFACPTFNKGHKQVKATTSIVTYMEIEDGHIDVVQQLSVILDRIAARKEYNNFLLHILLQKREKKKESPIGRANYVSLCQGINCAGGSSVFHIDMQSTRPEGYSCKVFDLCCCCGREQHGLTTIFEITSA